MTHYLIPDHVFDCIYDITPAFLRSCGVRGVLIDIDGTAASHHDPDPSEALCAYVASVRAAGIAVLFLSNNRASRVERFCRPMGVAWISRACKPFQRNFLAAASRLRLNGAELAVIGDQIFTDTLGGNRLGALTCIVRSLDEKEFWIGVRSRLERRFIERGRRRKEEGHVH